MAKDKFHDAVKEALEKEGWVITHDPYSLKIDETTYSIDLGAEFPIGAERNGEKIAVEVKSFLRESMVNEFHTALGQYLDYETNLPFQEPEREICMAVPTAVHRQMQKTRAVRNSLERFRVRLAIFEPIKKVIEQWKRY